MAGVPERPHADLAARRSPPCGDGSAAAVGDATPGWPSLLGGVRHVDQTWMHRVNSALVLACIREHGPISRVKIAERTALSRATVTAITRALLREGVIREGERAPSSARGGRRAVLLHAVAHREGGPDVRASGR